MFYEPRKKNHGFTHNPINAIVAPRPIGWISTKSATGKLNLAPFSYFNLMSYQPPIVIFMTDSWKDTAMNIEATKEFVCNIATLDLLQPMVLTSATLPEGESEFEFAKLETAPSQLVAPPRVARTPCAMECVYTETIRIKDKDGNQLERPLILGEVIGVYIDDSVIVDGQVRADKMRSLGRCGYLGDYVAIEQFHLQNRPNYPSTRGGGHGGG